MLFDGGELMESRFEVFNMLINRISRSIRRIKNHEMAEYHLRSPHISCLYYVYRAKSITATELCESCEEDKATISRSLDYLEANGYITRRTRLIKRYKTPYVLTEKGEAVGRKIAEKIDNILNEIDEVITDEERKSLYRSLFIISDKLDMMVGGTPAKNTEAIGVEVIGEQDLMTNDIPIFFSTDDNYIPYLDVALASLIENASKDYRYKIIVLNTGLEPENIAKVKKNERPGFEIEFVDISEQLEGIKSKLKNVYHFSIVTYYRLFIASLFPQYDKVIYLDCDLVVTGDISELYNTELNDNILGACPEEYVQNTPEFRIYAEKALGVDPDTYVNAGVLVMNLAEFRKNKIEKKFIKLITKYDFDLLDPDQAYLNYLCRGKILVLPNGWNKEPFDIECEGKKNIVHYALYKKPWQYDDVTDGEYFWEYARRSPFYDVICERRKTFGEAEMAEKEAAATEILEHALKIVDSDETFANKL